MTKSEARKLVPYKYHNRIIFAEDGSVNILIPNGEIYFLDDYTMRCVCIDFTTALRFCSTLDGYNSTVFNPDGEGFRQFDFRVHKLKNVIINTLYPYFEGEIKKIRAERVLAHAINP